MAYSKAVYLIASHSTMNWLTAFGAYDCLAGKALTFLIIGLC
jgi:hypothetical protein